MVVEVEADINEARMLIHCVCVRKQGEAGATYTTHRPPHSHHGTTFVSKLNRGPTLVTSVSKFDLQQ